MALVTRPNPANLTQVITTLGANPATHYLLVGGCVTEPQGYTLPRCRINVMSSGSVPGPAAGRLGVQPGRAKYKATLQHVQRASPGSNSAVYLTSGVYETNCTFDAESFAADDITHNPANYLSAWTDPREKRAYLVMPMDIAPLNESAEREHCLDFIRAYELTLHAVDEAFHSLHGFTMDGYLTQQEATNAMVKRVEGMLAPALRPCACDPVKLEQKFKSVMQKSRDERDGRGWHSFGLEVLDQPPQGHDQAIYLTGGPRQEAGRVYLRYTKGNNQINMHSPEEVITL